MAKAKRKAKKAKRRVLGDAERTAAERREDIERAFAQHASEQVGRKMLAGRKRIAKALERSAGRWQRVLRSAV